MTQTKSKFEGFLLSPQQNRIWRRESENNNSLVKFVLKIKGAVEIDSVREIIERIAARQESFRIEFEQFSEIETPLQKVNEKTEFEFRNVHIDSEMTQDEIIRLLSKKTDSNSPKIIISVGKLGDEILLCIPFDARNADAESANILCREILNEINGDSVNKVISAVQYASLQNEILSENKFSDESEYIWHTPKKRKPLLAKDSSKSSDFQKCELEINDFRAKLSEICGKYEIPEKDILLTVWALVAAKYVNGDSVSINVETDGRIYRELDNFIGRCAKSLPLEFTISISENCAEMIEKVSFKRTEAETFQDSFDPEILGEEKNIFGFSYRLLKTIAEGEFCAETVAVIESQHDSHLYLQIVEKTESLIAELHFDPNFFAKNLAEEMFRSFREILDQFCAEPEIALGQLNFLSDEDLKKYVLEQRQSETEFEFKNVYEMFHDAAFANQNQPAIISDETLTFSELLKKTDILAVNLRKHGIKSEQTVALYLPHCADSIIAMLAVLKLGACYLPIEISTPKERLDYLLKDSGSIALITTSEFAENLQNDELKTFLIDDLSEFNDSENEEYLLTAIEPNQTAYLIYTSGSTGKPKGVAVTHQGLSNYLQWACGFYRGNSECGAPIHSSTAFDMAVTTCFVPLLNGKSVVFTKELTADNPASLIELWNKTENFDFVKLTPSHAAILGKNLEIEKANNAEKLILGGENLTVSDLEFFSANAPETLVINEYGPTETVVGCAVFAEKAGSLNGQNVPIGKAIANTQIYVLDENLHSVPQGVVGELFIGGFGVARGYLNNFALTAEKFLPDPFAENSGSRLYRTGDLVYRNEKGDLIYLGRNDSQVKIRGFRVELGEIEAALREIENVAQSAVIVVNDNETPNIYGFAVLQNESANINEEILREQLSAKLPAVMIPVSITVLREFPLNANGKIDRKRLAEKTNFSETSRYTPPRTIEEEILAGIWRQVLNLTQISIDDTYSSLGGDSIRSLQIISLAEERGLKVSVAQLLKLQTIRKIAAETKKIDETSQAKIRIPFSLISKEDSAKMPKDAVDAYPLSRLQSGMVFHRELNPESAVYHDVFGYRVKAPLDIDKLREAVNELGKRHPVLRTSFDLANFETPLQIVHEKAEIPFGIDDISRLSNEEQEKLLEEFLENEKKNDFDLRRAPLLRFHLHIRDRETFQFWISFHHAVMDGWTDISLLVELALSYRELLQGKVISVKPPRAFFRDFIELEFAELASEESREFWKAKLKDAPLMKIPRENAENLPKERGSLLVPIDISTETSNKLQDLARMNAVPVKSVLLAAHTFVMSFLSANDDVVTTLTAVGRPESLDGDRVFGLHLNSMPFRQKLSGRTWQELVCKTFDIEREAMPYRRFPMAEIQQMIGGETVAETLFYFTHYYNALDLSAFPEMEVFDWYGYEETSFTLSVHFSIEPHSARIVGNLDADRTLLSPEQVKKYAEYYARTLSEMAGNSNGKPQNFTPFNEVEKQTKLKISTTSEKNFDSLIKSDLIDEIFENAKKNSSASAIKFGDKILTYKDLIGKAEHLAQILSEKGIRAEKRVAISLERSPELVVSILAVMISGATYVPIDPDYPTERKRFMLSDSSPELVISKSDLSKFAEDFHQVLIDEIDLSDSFETVNLNEYNPENAAYVIYTSGSTGHPKGVVVSRSSLSKHTDWAMQFYELTQADRVLQFAPIGFDVFAEEMFPTLGAGGELVLWTEKNIADTADFFSFIERENISVINLPSPYWHEIVNSIEENHLKMPSCLRYVITGSDTVSAQKVKAWKKHFPEKPLLNNSYGLTETTVTSSVYEIGGVDDFDNFDTVPIGKPVRDSEMFIFDERFRPVPDGVAGEIFIGGDKLARGYLNRPALTAEKFIPHPFSEKNGARLYRTGDLGIRQTDGNVIFLGRTDEQIKIRGFRIEIGEIENTFLQNEGINSAAVVVFTQENGEKKLNAFIEINENFTGIDELRLNLRISLPNYMIPSNIQIIEEIPRTSNGKIDRRKLEKSEIRIEEKTENFIFPRNDAEYVLAQICAEVLERKQIGVTTDFFEMGGHSLLAVRFVARIRNYFQIEIPLSFLYENTTIEKIATFLESEFGGKEKLNEVAAIIRQVLEMTETEAVNLLQEK